MIASRICENCQPPFNCNKGKCEKPENTQRQPARSEIYHTFPSDAKPKIEIDHRNSFARYIYAFYFKNLVFFTNSFRYDPKNVLCASESKKGNGECKPIIQDSGQRESNAMSNKVHQHDGRIQANHINAIKLHQTSRNYAINGIVAVHIKEDTSGANIKSFAVALVILILITAVEFH